MEWNGLGLAASRDTLSCLCFRGTLIRFSRWSTRIALHDPGLVEVRVLDGFAGRIAIHVFGQSLLREMITVAGVQRAVLCLDDARVMIRAGFRAGFIKLQVPFPFPGPAFIVGDLHGEAVTVALGVVADEDPVG